MAKATAAGEVVREYVRVVSAECYLGQTTMWLL